MTTPVTDLADLLRTMRPTALPDEYVFVEVDDARLSGLSYSALVREAEGTGVVMRRQDADEAGLEALSRLASS